jgi:uncharacterized protein
MYIQQAKEGLTDWWRYIVGCLFIIAGVLVFSAPHSIAISIKTIAGEVDLTRMNDLNYLMTLFDSNLNLVFILLPFLGGLIMLLVTTRHFHKLSFLKLTTSREKIDFKRVALSFSIWSLFTIGSVVISYYVNPSNFQWNFKLWPFITLFVLAVVLIPIQTSFEEYVFRGYLLQGIGIVTKKPLVALLSTSIIFGLLHISNPEVEKIGYTIMIYYIGTGVFLAILTLMDEGMELALGFHAANNLITALLVTSDWTAFQTHSILKDLSDPSKMGFIEIFLPVFIIFPALIFLFSKIYNWNNWKEKLIKKLK